MKDNQTIHELIAERQELAATYAKDGAFRSAERVMRDLAETIKGHREWCDAN